MTNRYKYFAIAWFASCSFASGADAPPYYASPEQAPYPTGYQPCVTHSCQLVPEIKQIKKTVYEVQEVPYCVKKGPPLWALLHHHGCECEACAQCDCVRYKKVLVKREVVCEEVCTTKCVVQQHIQHVPCAPPCQK